MIPIKNGEITHANYEKIFENILYQSSSAIESYRCLTHCILIYTEANSSISEMINNQYQYAELNAKSGRYLNIYHARANLANLEPNKEYNLESRMMIPNSDLDIYKQTPQYRRFVEFINTNYFTPKNEFTPFMLFFSIKNKRLSNTWGIEIDQLDPFNNIVEIIWEVTRSVSMVIDDNIENQDQILNLAIANLKNYKIKSTFKKMMDHAPLFLAIAGLFR